MTFGTMPTVEDRTVELAQSLLRVARRRLVTAEGEHYCCNALRNQEVGKAKKQVKRWETWLIDRDILAGEDDDSDDSDDS